MSGGGPPIAYYVQGIDRAGDDATYPGDDYLRNTSAEGWPLITTDAEAVATARAACIADGWEVAHVYRRTSDGMHVLVETLRGGMPVHACRRGRPHDGHFWRLQGVEVLCPGILAPE